jgi:predicted PurR-regulated permease PerM
VSDPHEGETGARAAPVDVRSAALTIVAVLAIVTVLRVAQAMIIPIVLAVLISYALDPVVAWLARRRVPRAASSAVLLIAVVAAAGSTLYGLRYQVTEIVAKLPESAIRIRRSLAHERPAAATGTTAIQQVQKAATELQKAADAAATPAAAPAAPPGVTRVQVESTPFNLSDYLLWGSIGIVAALGQVVLVLFLVYFLLASGDLYKRKLVKIVGPSLTQKKITLQILADIEHQIGTFLLIEVFTSVVVGFATWLAFRWIGLEQAAVWGLLAGINNSIPYFGPVLVTAGTAAVGFLQFGTIHMALLVAGVSLVITALEGFLLTPWLTGRASRMNAVAIFVGLLFWGWVWGVWGLLLAVPMLMVIKAVSDHVEEFKEIGELLGD